MRLRAIAIACACAAAAALSGCATPNQFANAVVDANVAQELAHNRLVLLNIVRAYKRMPMHFSRLSSARVPVGAGNPTFSLPTPFGPESLVLRYDWATTLGIQQGVDSTPLDSQEFMRGITTPVSAATMLYYLDQGWPQQMILHLFVRAIEVYETDAKGDPQLIDRYVNYPQNEQRFEQFQRAIQGLAGCEIDGFADRNAVAYGPMFKADQLGTLEALAAARNADLRLAPVDAQGKVVSEPHQVTVGYQLFRDARFTSLKITDSPLQNTRCEMPGESRDAKGNRTLAPLAKVQSDGRPGSRGKDEVKRTAVYVLRSPEAMLYYLGEIGRVQLDLGRSGVPRIGYQRDRQDTGPTGAQLFQLSRGDAGTAAVSVSHEGEVFSIPRSTVGNRSMHVVSLMTQLLGLHNKGNDAPATLNVRTVP